MPGSCSSHGTKFMHSVQLPLALSHVSPFLILLVSFVSSGKVCPSSRLWWPCHPVIGGMGKEWFLIFLLSLTGSYVEMNQVKSSAWQQLDDMNGHSWTFGQMLEQQQNTAS